MTNQVRRKRASHCKSHGGCVTCHERHIKCDETRPFCHRCHGAGRICGGYRPPSKLNVQLRSICPRPMPLPSAIRWNDRESITLDFFRRATLHQLPCASATEVSWEHVALDLVYQHPPISAAASACAALHRAVTDTQEDDQRHFALQQYNKSISLVRKHITNLRSDPADEDILVVLVACLLLFTYEAFSGQDAKASLHFRSGLRLIHERRQPNEGPQTPNGRRVVVVQPSAKSLFDVLVQTFIRLDSDYTLTGSDDPYLYPVCEEPMPPKLRDPNQASLYLEVIAARTFDTFDVLYDHNYCFLAKHRDLDHLDDDEENCLVRSALRSVELDGPLIEGIEEVRRSLQAWLTAFATSPRTHRNLIAHNSAQIFFFCVRLWVTTWRDETSVLVDRFEPQFEYFTCLWEQYLELHNAKTPFRNKFGNSDARGAGTFSTPPALSLGSGVVTCLVAIAERCRTSKIRRRCIATLREINLTGVFNTGYLVAYLKAIVEHEERAARVHSPQIMLDDDMHARDVPEAARLLEVAMSPSYHVSNFDFYKAKQVSMVYVTKASSGVGEELRLGTMVVPVA